MNIPSSYVTLSKPSITFPSSTIFIGYIKESNFGTAEAALECLCPIPTDEIIIYGKSGSNIVFSFLKKSLSFSISVSTSLEDKMSCKKINNSRYICAVIYENRVFILVFVNKLVLTKCEMSLAQRLQLGDLLNYHTDVELYDTNVVNTKMVCARNLNTNDIECLYVQTNFKFALVCSHSAEVSKSQLIIQFPTESENNGECILQGFASEILFCCSGTNLLKCTRLDNDYSVLNSFVIELKHS